MAWVKCCCSRMTGDIGGMCHNGPAEKEYSSAELECKALHNILLYYDAYLQGVRFDAFTDHCALIYMVRAQTASNNGRSMRYLMDIQHHEFIKKDAVSRLPRYLSADDLELDMGPVLEEYLLVAKDLEVKRRRRILRSETRRLNKMKEKAECKDTMATLARTETERVQCGASPGSQNNPNRAVQVSVYL